MSEKIYTSDEFVDASVECLERGQLCKNGSLSHTLLFQWSAMLEQAAVMKLKLDRIDPETPNRKGNR